MVAQKQGGELGIPSIPPELGMPRLQGGGGVSSGMHIPVLRGWSCPGVWGLQGLDQPCPEGLLQDSQTEVGM